MIAPSSPVSNVQHSSDSTPDLSKSNFAAAPAVVVEVLLELREAARPLLEQSTQPRRGISLLGSGSSGIDTNDLLRICETSSEAIASILPEHSTVRMLDECIDTLHAQGWRSNIPQGDFALAFPLLNSLVQRIDVEIAKLDSELFITRFQDEYSKILEAGGDASSSSFVQLLPQAQPGGAFQQYVMAALALGESLPESFTEPLQTLLGEARTLHRSLVREERPKIGFLPKDASGSEGDSLETRIQSFGTVLKEQAAKLESSWLGVQHPTSVESQLSAFAASAAGVIRSLVYQYDSASLGESAGYNQRAELASVMPSFIEAIESVLGRSAEYAKSVSHTVHEQ